MSFEILACMYRKLYLITQQIVKLTINGHKTTFFLQISLINKQLTLEMT